MSEIYLTKKEARKFILHKQGLSGDYRFVGKDGIVEYIRQAGCIQFDPIDVCGKNAELVLQSRISGFTKDMLYELLYKDRKLLDYFDKNLSIIPAENWIYYERERENHRKWERSQEEIKQVHDKINAAITEKGPLCSSDLDMSQKVDWYWSSTKLSRAALEHMYFSGELAVHHKNGSNKYYDLIENCIPEEILKQPDPYPCDHDHKKWRVLQRIGSLGLLWNRASDAWLGIDGLKAKERDDIFAELLAESLIASVNVENINHTLYCRMEDIKLLDNIRKDYDEKLRCELIAPLDNMMWDRRLIKELFGFEYKWEIYTPVEERKYGYYVLPVLYGDSFVGRIEVVADKKAKILAVKNIWFEDGVKQTKKMLAEIEKCIKRFARFNECKDISWDLPEKEEENAWFEKRNS